MAKYERVKEIPAVMVSTAGISFCGALPDESKLKVLKAFIDYVEIIKKTREDIPTECDSFDGLDPLESKVLQQMTNGMVESAIKYWAMADRNAEIRNRGSIQDMIDSTKSQIKNRNMFGY